MSRLHRWLGLLGGVGLAVAMAAPAFAYGPQVPHTITVTPASGTLLCERPTAVLATVLDQSGMPIKGVTVTWSFASSPSSADRILQTTSKTNKDGVARTMVRLACVAGDRVIRASAGGVNGTAVIQVSLDRSGTRGAVLGVTSRPLPNTSTVTVEAAPAEQPSPVVPLGVALLLATTLVLRRTLRRR